MDVSSPDEMYIEFREYENIDEDAPKVTKLKRPTEKVSQIVGTQLNAYYRLWKKHWPAEGVLRPWWNKNYFQLTLNRLMHVVQNFDSK